MIAAFFAVSVAVVGVLLVFRSPRLNDAAGVLHSVLFAAFAGWLCLNDSNLSGYLRIDDLGRWFLVILAVLDVCSALNNIEYMKHLKLNPRSHTFYWVSYVAFIACMAGVILSAHIGLLWVFVEASTLVTAYLINMSRTKASLEAVWKYLFICSVGISLAFVGIVFLGLAVGGSEGLFLEGFSRGIAATNPIWLKLAFVFILIGFGTKMGLAPVHAWLPDAHSESPAPVSALLSGTLLNTAFIGILRVYRLVEAAGQGDFARTLFVIMGCISLLVAATYVLRVTNYKRLLAYSSIENMGILALAVGAGGKNGLYASMLHLAAHSLTKGMLFLTSGTILGLYGTKAIDGVRGLVRRDAKTAWLWIGGFVLIMGIPPSPIFTSEFLVLKELFPAGRDVPAELMLFLLTVILYGFGSVVLWMAGGRAPDAAEAGLSARGPGLFAYLPQFVCLTLIIVLGLYPPEFVVSIIERAREAIL